MEVDVSDKNLRLKKLSIPHAKNSTWPIEKKIEAVTTWLALGNLRHVAGVTGVGYDLIKQWRMMPWWKDLEAEIIASRRVKSANKLSKIVDKSLDVIDDRLENGDFILNNKTGEIMRKQVTLRDATTAANALMQRQAILEKLNKDEQTIESTVNIVDQLKNLANEFAKFNKSKGFPSGDGSITEATIRSESSGNEGVTNALHDERQTGLQKGSGEIHFEA